MLADFYKDIILKKPKFVFLSLIILLTFFGFYSKDFRLDASSDTLLIEGDPDLEYLREINDRYGAKEFLVLTYAPKEPITSQTTINNLLSLKYKIKSLDFFSGTITYYKTSSSKLSSEGLEFEPSESSIPIVRI